MRVENRSAETQMAASSVDAAGLYLDLVEKSVLDDIYGSHTLPCPNQPWAKRPCTKEEVDLGHRWPDRAHTMIGRARLRNIRDCLEDVLKNDVPGDVIETGVWRGGATIYMKAILKAHGAKRLVYVADSFCGLPKPEADRYPWDLGDMHWTLAPLAVSRADVQRNFEAYDLLDEDVRFVEGWFEEAIPKAGVGKLSILRLDGDMYASTMQVFELLYDKLEVGGYCIIDDYALGGCQNAVIDFRAARGIEEPMLEIDWTGRYWRKARI